MKKVVLGIVGSRTYTNYAIFKERLERLIEVNNYEVTTVVSGAAVGVDTMARNWCVEKNIPIIEHKPDYKTYHFKKAPLLRNTLIANDCEVLVAFVTPTSSGTYDTINKANKLGKLVFVESV